MLRVIFTSLLLINSIFWGIYPESENSPHNLLLKKLNIDYNVKKRDHILIGTVLYILAVSVSQTENINNIWF